MITPPTPKLRHQAHATPAMHFCPTCSNLLLLEVRCFMARPDACRTPR